MNNKTAITALLTDSVHQFNELISNLNKNEFEINLNNKWSAGQDLVHLIKVLRIVHIGFVLPKPLLRQFYGINKNEPRSFEQLQILFKKAMENGAISPTMYIPKPILFKDKNDFLKKHKSLNERLINRINLHNDMELDLFRLPHPIFGKVSLRELAIFTSFHTLHHFELLKSKLDK